VRDVKRNGYKTRPRRAWVRWAWRTPKCIEHCTSRVGQPQAYGNACYARLGATYSMTLIGSRTTAYTVMSAHARCSCEVLCRLGRFVSGISLPARADESRSGHGARRVSRRMCPRMFMTCVTCVVCALNWRLTRLPTTCHTLFLINGRRQGMLPRRYPHGATAPAKRTCRPPHYPRPQHVHFSARRTIPVPLTRLHAAVILCEFTSAAPS
jgi:hypothetical protein